MIAFLLYVVSLLYDSFWFISSPTESTSYVAVGFFIIATGMFFFVGLFAILSVYPSMKKEFEEITKRQKELRLNDFGKGTDSVTIAAELGLNDAGKGTDSVTIKKIDNEEES